MSWTEELYTVYEKQCGKDNGGNMLLPVSHSTANAQLEVTIDEGGSFIAAVKVEKADAVTIIPVTEASGAKSSGNAPHPFADKFKYIAGDYNEYIDGKKNDRYFNAYIQQLTKWANSEYTHPAIKAVLAYLGKSTLIKDLISARVLETDESGKLRSDVKLAGFSQCDCFVRFRIIYSDKEHESRTWCDNTLYDAFISFNSTLAGTKQLCYALGKELPVTYKHPNRIRNAGDKAKLISTNDKSGFTYRGRFADKEQAASVSYEFSQKMHNALKWLIQKQSTNIGSMTVTIWESALAPCPNISADFMSMFGTEISDEDLKSSTDELVTAYREQLRKSIFGCKMRLEPDSKTMLLLLDAATTGRLSISGYTEILSSDFLSSIEKWHNDTAWIHFNSEKKFKNVNSFSLWDITECAYGTEQSGKIECKPELKKDIFCRLLPCVTEGRKLPCDIVNSLVQKACNPLCYEKNYNWRRVLETACGMIRKKTCEIKEDCSMALDNDCNERDYLYGRLLAVAEAAENSTYKNDEDGARTTNARRYFSAFSIHPASTWLVIKNRLEPYLNRMSEPSRIFYSKLINEITDKFTREAFADNSKLKPEFLHAYSCQLQEIYSRKNKEEK